MGNLSRKNPLCVPEYRADPTQTWECVHCGELNEEQVTGEAFGDQSYIYCKACFQRGNRVRVPRIIDLTQPMPCIVLVRVTEDMEESGDIPF